jgi:hypothetical protein
LRDLFPALALVTEVRMKNRFARRLLETYVGPHASEQILSGHIRRGSGVAITAVVMICDLRGFTTIEFRQLVAFYLTLLVFLNWNTVHEYAILSNMFRPRQRRLNRLEQDLPEGVWWMRLGSRAKASRSSFTGV